MTGGGPGIRRRSKRTVAISLATVFALLSVFHVIGAFGTWRALAVIPTVACGCVYQGDFRSQLVMSTIQILIAICVGSIISALVEIARSFGRTGRGPPVDDYCCGCVR